MDESERKDVLQLQGEVLALFEKLKLAEVKLPKEEMVKLYDYVIRQAEIRDMALE